MEALLSYKNCPSFMVSVCLFLLGTDVFFAVCAYICVIDWLCLLLVWIWVFVLVMFKCLGTIFCALMSKLSTTGYASAYSENVNWSHDIFFLNAIKSRSYRLPYSHLKMQVLRDCKLRYLHKHFFFFSFLLWKVEKSELKEA
jgi:hypothetical protein